MTITIVDSIAQEEDHLLLYRVSLFDSLSFYSMIQTQKEREDDILDGNE
jgi:hypothetical protein